MYIIECVSDNSLLVVNNSQIICDETIEVGDSVNFVYKKTSYVGTVKFFSDDDEIIKKEFTKLKNRKKDGKLEKPPTVVNKSPPPSAKRTRQLSRKTNNDAIPVKKPRIDHFKNKKRQSKENTSKKTVIVPSDSEPSDLEHEEEYDNSKNSENSSNLLLDEAPVHAAVNAKVDAKVDATVDASIESDASTSAQVEDRSTKTKMPEKFENVDLDDSGDLDDDNQLIGPSEPNMKHIGNGIYCRKKILKLAVRGSTAATHVARKLLEGVFKPEILLKCTLSGKPPTAQGKERQQEEVVAMNSKAKKSIVDYALKTAVEHNWSARTEAQIDSSLGQKLVEIKLKNRKNREFQAEA